MSLNGRDDRKFSLVIRIGDAPNDRLGAVEDRAGYVRECALIIQFCAGCDRQEVHENHA
jgi:hypothetical protein